MMQQAKKCIILLEHIGVYLCSTSFESCADTLSRLSEMLCFLVMTAAKNHPDDVKTFFLRTVCFVWQEIAEKYRVCFSCC